MTDLNTRAEFCRFTATAAAMSAGDEITTPLLNIKKNHTYTFSCCAEAFPTLVIGHGRDTYDSSYLTIEPGKLSFTIRYHEATTTEYPMFLSFHGDLTVMMMVGVNTVDVRLASGGDTVSIYLPIWVGDGNAPTFAALEKGEISDVTFVCDYPDFALPLYAFGDSYFGMTSPARWCNYLRENRQLDNVLLNAYPGESSVGTVAALESFPMFGAAPKVAVWTLGMNNGSDTDGQPEPHWLEDTRKFLAWCEACGAEPVLATIPTVPSRYHEEKNRFIRESGYRVLDFAAAVGADDKGNWLPGMLAADEVHPDVEGAKALYARAIADVPEFAGID